MSVRALSSLTGLASPHSQLTLTGSCGEHSGMSWTRGAHLSPICNEQGRRGAGRPVVPGIRDVAHGPGAPRGLETCIAGWGVHEPPIPHGAHQSMERARHEINLQGRTVVHLGGGPREEGGSLPRETRRSTEGGWAIFTVTRGEVDPAEIKMEIAEAVTRGGREGILGGTTGSLGLRGCGRVQSP